MAWSENDLQRLRNKGLVIDDKKNTPASEITIEKKAIKIAKISVEKNTIELYMKMFLQEGKIEEYQKEFRFDTVRRFRFDWAIPDRKIAIEYEGIYSEKSGHTTLSGYNKDVEKYNLAVSLGWKVLRYTSLNYKDLENELNKLLLD